MNRIMGTDDPTGLVLNVFAVGLSIVLAAKDNHWRLFTSCLLVGGFVWAFFMAVGLPTLMVPCGFVWMPFTLVLAVRNFLKQRQSSRKRRNCSAVSIRHIEERRVQMDITVHHVHEYPQYLSGPVSAQCLSAQPKPEKQKSPLFYDE